MTRRPESPLLHGPWPETETDPDTRALTELKAEFPQWTIWRAMSARRAMGDWCARRTESGRPSSGVSAKSPDELREQIQRAV